MSCPIPLGSAATTPPSFFQNNSRKAYIRASACISPQDSFGSGKFPFNAVDHAGCRYLTCIEPAYRDYIDPMAGRRMSRVVKMGVSAAKQCMNDAGADMPGAIITGTGLGCIADTEKFLGSIILNEEKLLNPTPFIQSTHNTVASSIALAIKCHAYNSTYVHRGFSFEHALLDAMMQLQEQNELLAQKDLQEQNMLLAQKGSQGQQILVGAVDEITEHAYDITRRMGFWKGQVAGNLTLLQTGGRGTLPGEGVAFFMLGSSPGDNAGSMIRGMDMLYKPAGFKAVQDGVTGLLARAEIASEDIDLAILGMNGDKEGDEVYGYLQMGILKEADHAYYKHLCGEYDTSSSFALWLADRIIVTGQVPGFMQLSPFRRKQWRHVLIYNHFHGINHSLILLSAC